MKIVKLKEVSDQATLCQEAADLLVGGGLLCLPCAGRYRVVADFTNRDAVISLMQSKRRVRKAPALVFIDGEDKLPMVAGIVDPIALEIARALWPQPLTIRVDLNEELPRAVVKQLGGAKSKLGVRIPSDPLMKSLVGCIGRPLLISSANKEKKSGESSPAQVRKTFASSIDLFIDNGDLQPEPRSTVIDIVDGKVVVERAGAISNETLAQYAAVAA